MIVLLEQDPGLFVFFLFSSFFCLQEAKITKTCALGEFLRCLCKLCLTLSVHSASGFTLLFLRAYHTAWCLMLVILPLAFVVVFFIN